MPIGIYPRKIKPISERLFKHVTKGPSCWLWTGSKTRFGHGQLMSDMTIDKKKRLVFAHRASWEIHNGAIPDGLYVLHKCDTPNCVNPAHLFLGTKADNSADMIAKGRSKRGAQLPQTKLSEHDVRFIRSSQEKASVLRKRFGVSDSTIRFVRNGTNWKYIQP